jgi:hypothetical protein
MTDENKNLEILINTKADLAGANATEAALDRIKAKTAEGAAATAGFESLIRAMEDVRERTHQAEAATRAFFRELQRTLNQPETDAESAAMRTQSLQEVARFEEEMAARRHQRELSNLQAAENAGLLSHQEASRRKDAMAEEYHQRRLAQALKQTDDQSADSRHVPRDTEATAGLNQARLHPANTDVQTGLPMNPAQSRPLNSWAPGDQSQNDARGFAAAAPTVAVIDPGKYPAEVQPLIEQYQKDFTAYHNLVVSGLKTNNAAINTLATELTHELEILRSQMNGLKNK